MTIFGGLRIEFDESLPKNTVRVGDELVTMPPVVFDEPHYRAVMGSCYPDPNYPFLGETGYTINPREHPHLKGRSIAWPARWFVGQPRSNWILVGEAQEGDVAAEQLWPDVDWNHMLPEALRQ